jgi:hypothetical protein
VGGFCEPWARLLLVGAAGDEPMGIHKRGPHVGLRACGCREGGPGLGGVVYSLFRGFGLLLLEGVVRAANPALVCGQGGCSFGHNLTGGSKASEGSLVDVARADTVDVELDRLISKRASQDQRPDPDEQEAIWKASLRAYNEKRRQMAQGETHMNRRRKNQFREALDAKREALASAAKQPKQEPETPELRAEVLSDRLAEREAELAKDRGGVVA